MKGKLYTWGFALILSALLLSGCGTDTLQSTEIPTDTPTGITVEVPAEVRDARDAALTYVLEQYGTQAPATGLTWAEENITPGWPEKPVPGWAEYRFTGENWIVTIGHAVLPPEQIVYQVTVIDQNTGFRWVGQVDAMGQVSDASAPTPAPVAVPDPARARDTALAYVSDHYGLGWSEQAPAPELRWIEEEMTPEGLVGSQTLRYTAENWDGEITVTFPVVAPENIVFQVLVTVQSTGLRWEGEVDATGQVTETSAPTPISRTEPVENWWGEIVSNPPGSQFDDYFQRQIVDGDQYGIESLDPDIQAQIVALRDTGTTVHVWGTLHHDVPDYNASQIQVTRIEIPEAPAPPDITEEAVQGWIGTIGLYPPGSQLSDYFVRDDGERYGIQPLDGDAIVRQLIEDYQWTGAQVQVWGRLLTGIPDVENRQIQVERIEVLSGPAVTSRNLSPFAEMSASSALPSDRWGTYHAWSAIDGSLSTPWTEGVDGPGVGEWIMLTFPSAIEVHSIGVDVGYDRDEGDTFHSADLFDKNNRLKRATLIFSDGEQVELTFEDVRGIQMMPLARAPIPIQTTFVKVVIEEVYPGSKFDDTCLAEIEVWGKTK